MRASRRYRALAAAAGALGVALAGSPPEAPGVTMIPSEALQAGGQPELSWGPWVSEVPLVDLSGAWLFDYAESDPMVEVWRERPIVYRIVQHPDGILLEFMPEGATANRQAYRWDGGVVASRRGDVEVRERARWTGGGRVLEVEGRRWVSGAGTAAPYALSYRLEGPDLLVFVQSDEHGETVWRFRRRQAL